MKNIVFFVALSLLFVSVSSAELIDRGGGLIYDTGRDITWLQDANYAKTSGYDDDGLMYLRDATNFINKLRDESYLGYNDWFMGIGISEGELPNVFEGEVNYYGYLDEILHSSLYYNDGVTFNATSPFINLQGGQYGYFSADYWINGSGYPNYSGSYLFKFYFENGRTHLTGLGNALSGNYPNTQGYVWPIRYGDSTSIAVVPEPISSTLFIAGGAMLAGRRYLKKKK